MQDKTVKLETYKLAKRKGFVNECTYYVPTQTCIQKWLREDKSIFLFVNLRTINNKIGFSFHIISKHNGFLQNISNWNKEFEDKYYGGINKGDGIVFETFEDALEEGLTVSLNLI